MSVEINAPNTPSQVFLGLISGASFVLPKKRPTKYAELSATQTINKIEKRNIRPLSKAKLNEKKLDKTKISAKKEEKF